MSISVEELDYPLPPELIAQSPADRRDASRLLVVHRIGQRLEHRHFSDLPEYLRPGDRLFRNNAAVIPARLSAVRPTGGAVECLLLSQEGDPNTWRCLLRPARKLPPGSRFDGGSGEFTGEVLARGEHGEATVRFATPGASSILDVARGSGDVPLPPYIRRQDGAHRSEDLERYQTVYADPSRPVAVAAPTAGLHFTPALLDRLAAAGVAFSDLTLHVGLGTFRPIATARVEDHPIHRELYEIPADTQARLLHPIPGRRVAVGTTSVRSIEDFLARAPGDASRPFLGESSLYIHPPYRFRAVDALITNFHLPRSTLLCLVASFLTPGAENGIAWLREIYAEAVRERYRFLSYGDAMLIL